MTGIINIYATGLVCMSVCADKGTTKESVEKQANILSPTGIKSRWKVSEDPFADGSPNPNECGYNSNRQHWLLKC
jgi:hypothetical protein